MPGGQQSTGLLLVNSRRVEVVAADGGRSLEDRRVRPETGLFGIQERATLLGAGGGRQRQVASPPQASPRAPFVRVRCHGDVRGLRLPPHLQFSSPCSGTTVRGAWTLESFGCVPSDRLRGIVVSRVPS